VATRADGEALRLNDAFVDTPLPAPTASFPVTIEMFATGGRNPTPSMRVHKSRAPVAPDPSTSGDTDRGW
jgi:hypothetical protein